MKRMTTPAIVAGLAIAGLVAAALPVSAAPAPARVPTGAIASSAITATVPRADAATCGTIAIPSSITGTKPGDLIGSQVITPGNESPGVPLLTGAQTWRILYISAGADENSPQLVCGLVTAPATWTPDADGHARVIAWAHGTVGIKQKCQPSNNPDSGLFGKMPGGLGAVAWGSDLDGTLTSGLARNGALQTFIDQGYVIAATDYFSGIMPGSTTQNAYQHYAAGMPSGANVLDSVRAAIALVDPTGTATRWDMLTWGHSQGGGSALWAGQLARKYLAQTSPTVPVAPIQLVGIAAEAPATSFAAPSTAPTQLMGYHLGDLDMHMNITLNAKNAMDIGAVLFSYVLPNWEQLSATPATPGAKFPATPNDTALSLASMLAAKTASLKNAGLTDAPIIASYCLNNTTGELMIATYAIPYGTTPASNWYFIEQIWGHADEGYTKGYLDQTCATSTDAGIQIWCRWLRYNQPGPNGQNPFDKVPRNANGPVPQYIMQGEGDNILYCMPADQANPQQKECLAKQYYNSLAPAYCPNKGPANGSLQFNAWPVQTQKNDQGKYTLYHPASHMSIPGQASAPVSYSGVGTNDPNLKFTDSPLYAFINAAFNNPKSLPRGCSQQVMWDN